MEKGVLPEKLGEMRLRIPEKFLKEYAAEIRVILRPIPGIYPIDPGVLAKIRPETLNEVLQDYDLMLVPKARI